MTRINCSFCGASDHERERTIAGPTVFICSDCVGLCSDILADGPAARWAREAGEAEYVSWMT